MNKEIKFSIIIPVYNVQKYLYDCINSILNQNYHNFEVILIDDGSTDESGKICDSFKMSDSRISVKHRENRGAILSRLEGIEEAESDYILCVDSDDLLEKDTLDRVAKIIMNENYDAVFFNYSDLCCDGTKKKVSMPLAEGVYGCDEMLDTVISTTNHSLWNKVIKTSILKKIKFNVGKYYNLTINLDYVQLIPILCQLERIYFIEDSLYIYREVRNSIVHSFNEQKIIDLAISTQYVLEILSFYGKKTNQIIEKCLIAYLHMSSSRFIDLANSKINKKRKKEICALLHKNSIYRISRKYERFLADACGEYIVLKLFRYRMLSLIKLLFILSLKGNC